MLTSIDAQVLLAVMCGAFGLAGFYFGNSTQPSQVRYSHPNAITFKDENRHLQTLNLKSALPMGACPGKSTQAKAAKHGTSLS